MQNRLSNEQIEQLRLAYGSHAKAAKALGLSPRHYIRVRQGKNVTPMVVHLVDRILEDRKEAV